MEPNKTNTTPDTIPSMEQNTAPGTIGGAPKKVGPIIVGLIVVLVLIVVGLYMFASRPATDKGMVEFKTNTSSSTVVQTVKPITNTADDAQSLQNDLNNSTTGIDSQNF